MIASIVRVELTYAVYLAVALSICAMIYSILSRPIVSGVVGSILAMVLTSAFKELLPFNYWAHANDFIIEQFAPFLRNSTFRPLEAIVSLLFHVAVPTAIVWIGARWRHRRKGQTIPRVR